MKHALLTSHRGSLDITQLLSFGAVSGSIAGAGSWAGGGSRPDPSAGTGGAHLLVCCYPPMVTFAATAGAALPEAFAGTSGLKPDGA